MRAAAHERAAFQFSMTRRLVTGGSDDSRDGLCRTCPGPSQAGGGPVGGGAPRRRDPTIPVSPFFARPANTPPQRPPDAPRTNVVSQSEMRPTPSAAAPDPASEPSARADTVLPHGVRPQ